jgi:uncharacterized membrane protein YeaQ/YmgE (transglycosylase-associated protein family)
MDILIWVILGFLAGLVAKYLDPHPDNRSLLATTILGILGAVVGGFLASTFLGVGVDGLNITSFIVAVVGALIVLWIARRAGYRL